MYSGSGLKGGREEEGKAVGTEAVRIEDGQLYTPARQAGLNVGSET